MDRNTLSISLRGRGEAVGKSLGEIADENSRPDAQPGGARAMRNILAPVEAAPSAAVVSTLGNIAALLGEARRQGGKLDPAKLEALRSMANQVLDAVNAEPDMPAGALVNASDLVAMIADMTDPADFDPVEDPGDPGQAVSMAMSGEIVGKSQCLGEIVESYAGPLATPWGRPDRPTGVDFARTLARNATGKLDRR